MEASQESSGEAENMKAESIELELYWSDLTEEAQKIIETSANIVGAEITQDVKEDKYRIAWIGLNRSGENDID